MNNQAIADFPVWLHWFVFFSINVLQVRLTRKKPHRFARQQTWRLSHIIYE